MIIGIDKEYFIEKDDYSYTLKEKTGRFDKDKKEVNKTHGYFTNLEHALKKLRELKTVDKLGDFSTLSEYIKELRKQNQELINAVEGEK